MNPGNSDGPLVDCGGNWVGVVVAAARRGTPAMIGRAAPSRADGRPAATPAPTRALDLRRSAPPAAQRTSRCVADALPEVVMKRLALLLPLLLATPGLADERSVVDRIEELGRVQARGAADEVAAFLSDEDPKVRELAAQGLADLGAVTPRARAALVERLEDPDAEPRAAAALALVRLGLVEGTGAVAALASLAGLDAPPTAALVALWELGPAGAGAAEALRQRACRADAPLTLLQALARVSPRALARLLRDPAAPRGARSQGLTAASHALDLALADPRQELDGVLEPLLAAAQEGPDAELRRAAVTLLGRAGARLDGALRDAALAALDDAATRPGEDEQVVSMACHQGGVVRAAPPERERLLELARRLARTFDEVEAAMAARAPDHLAPLHRDLDRGSSYWAGSCPVSVDERAHPHLDAAWATADTMGGAPARLRLVFDDLRLRASVHDGPAGPRVVLLRPLEDTPWGAAVRGRRPFMVRSAGLSAPYAVLEGP